MVSLISILLIFLSFSIWPCEKYMVFEDNSRTSLHALSFCSNNCDPVKSMTEGCTQTNRCYNYINYFTIPVRLRLLSINITVEFGLLQTPSSTTPSCFYNFHPYLLYSRASKIERHMLKVPESKGWFKYKTWFKYIKRQEIQLPYLVSTFQVLIGIASHSCILNQVKISIETCLQKVTKLVLYPLSAVEGRVNGNCLPNSIQLKTSITLSAFCNYTTGYRSFQGGCQCKPGFMLINNNCAACISKEYKPQPGNQACYKCGNNSSRHHGSNQKCLCKKGFLRKYNESKDSSKPCFDKKRFGRCGYEKIYIIVNETRNESYTFPLSLIGDIQNFSCIHGQTDEFKRLNKSVNLKRECVLSGENKAVWTDLDLSSCKHKSFACASNEYKQQPESQTCYKCGNNSSRHHGSNETCNCKMGYLRKHNESKDSSKPCFEKKRFGQCGYEKIYVSFNEIYTFPLFLIGDIQKFSCIHGQTDEAKKLNKSVILERKCVLSRKDKAVWTDLDLSSCAHKKEFNISDMSPEDVNNETAVEVSHILSKLSSNITNMNNEKTLSDTTKILIAILKLQSKNPKVRLNVLATMDNILRIDSQIISSTNTSDNFFNFLDIIAKNTGNNYQFSGDQFALGIKVTTQPSNVDAHVLYEQSKVNISFDSYVNKNESKVDVLIPEAVFKQQNLSQDSKIVSHAFKDDKLFNQNNSKGDIGSLIMAVSIEGVQIENLETPIRFNFQTQRHISDDSTGQCVFWDKDGGSWSKRGCITSRDPDKTDVTVCKCDHLTNFAILFNVFEDNEKELKSSKELYWVSRIGCILSMVSLTATLISYLRFEVLRRRTAQKILLNFSSSLLILLVIFTAVVNVKRPSSALCQSMSTLLHLFMLSTFCWSAVQTLFLYKKAVRPTKNRGENKRAFWICFCLAWGIPIITSLSVGFASKSQFADPIPTLCILKGSVFTYTITVPVSIIVVSNLLAFFPIMHQIQRHITVRASFKHNDHPLRRRIKVTFGCIILLGLTWLFGFMAIGEARGIIHWLFNITNTLQGVFVFVFYVILNDEVKNVWKTHLTAMTNTDSTFVIQSSGSWQPAKSRATSELSLPTQDVVLTSFQRSCDVG